MTDLIWQIPLGLMLIVLSITFVKMWDEDD